MSRQSIWLDCPVEVRSTLSQLCAQWSSTASLIVHLSLIPLYLFSSWFAPNPSSVVFLGSPQNLTGPLCSKPHSSASLVGHNLHQHLPSATPHQSIVLQFGQDQHTPSLMNQHTPSSLMLTSQLPCTQLLSHGYHYSAAFLFRTYIVRKQQPDYLFLRAGVQPTLDPCAEAFHEQAHCTSPRKGGVWLMMCASVCMTAG